MTPLGALLAAKARMARRRAQAAWRESRLKVAFVGCSIALLWLAAFVLARVGLHWIDSLGASVLRGVGMRLSDLLLPRLAAAFAFVLFAMLLVSNALLAFATLFRSREVEGLVATPLSWRTLFAARFAEIVLFSSWSSAYLLSPVLLAYGIAHRSPPSFYLAAAALFLPFVIIPAAIGTLMAVLLACTLPRLPRLALATALVVLAAAGFLVLRSRLAAPEFGAPAELGGLLRVTASAQSPVLPSYWAAAGLFDAVRGDAGDVAFHVLLLLSNALFLTWLAAEAAARLFHPAFSALAGAAHRQGRRALDDDHAVLRGLLLPLPAPLRWLTIKDIAAFRRDPGQWSQVLVFFGVLAVYAATAHLPAHGFATGFWQGWMTLLNTVACLLVLATLTTRFVFPLVSLEGRRFWILGIAPLPPRRLLGQKFGLSVVFASLVTLGLAALTGWRLHLAALPFAAALLTVAASSVALSGIAVGLGAVFPNFAEDDPARISSGTGGTLTFIVSLAYVVLVGVAETVILRWDSFGRVLGGARAYPRAVAVALAAIALLTAAATVVPLRLGARALERAEF